MSTANITNILELVQQVEEMQYQLLRQTDQIDELRSALAGLRDDKYSLERQVTNLGDKVEDAVRSCSSMQTEIRRGW